MEFDVADDLRQSTQDRFQSTQDGWDHTGRLKTGSGIGSGLVGTGSVHPNGLTDVS